MSWKLSVLWKFMQDWTLAMPTLDSHLCLFSYGPELSFHGGLEIFSRQ